MKNLFHFVKVDFCVDWSSCVLHLPWYKINYTHWLFYFRDLFVRENCFNNILHCIDRRPTKARHRLLDSYQHTAQVSTQLITYLVWCQGLVEHEFRQGRIHNLLCDTLVQFEITARGFQYLFAGTRRKEMDYWPVKLSCIFPQQRHTWRNNDTAWCRTMLYLGSFIKVTSNQIKSQPFLDGGLSKSSLGKFAGVGCVLAM